MKKKLFFAMASVLLMLGILSFTLIHTEPAPKKAAKRVADINNPVSVVYGGGSITITWTASGSPHHFNYGGYGVVTSGSTTGNSMSYGIGSGTSRFGVQAVCSDGTPVGSTHGVLFGPSGYSLF